MRHLVVVAAFVLVGATSAANAQQGTADLRGRVLDAQQGAMPGVTVVVRNPETGIFRETTSGDDGSFFLGAMLPGAYQVEVMLEGFRPYQRAGVRLEVGRTSALDVVLEVVNYTNPAGDQRVASSFLKVTNIIGATRTAQINLRYGF